MCGRLDIHDPKPINRFLHRFEAPQLELPQLSYNVPPTEPVPVLYAQGGPRSAVMRWGLTPRFWKKDAPVKPLFNARDDSIWDRANFRGLIGHQHCVVLANGFYEWQKVEGNRAKQPWYVTLTGQGQRPLALAGIWQEDAEHGLECCVVTTAANRAMTEIHSRMPVILDAAGARDWLEARKRDAMDELLAPCPGSWLESWVVSHLVNSPENTGGRCIYRLTRKE